MAPSVENALIFVVNRVRCGAACSHSADRFGHDNQLSQTSVQKIRGDVDLTVHVIAILTSLNQRALHRESGEIFTREGEFWRPCGFCRVISILFRAGEDPHASWSPTEFLGDAGGSTRCGCWKESHRIDFMAVSRIVSRWDIHFSGNSTLFMR